MGLVARKPTPLSPPEYTAELARAYVQLYHRRPHPNVLAVAAGIVGLENARGAAILNHNWGNIMWVHQSPDYWEHPKPQAGAPRYFAAFRNHNEGARVWWRQIVKRNTPVLDRAWHDDPKGAVAMLYKTGYVAELSPGEEQGYAKAVASMYKEAHDKWIPTSGATRDVLGVVCFSATVGTVALLVARKFLS